MDFASSYVYSYDNSDEECVSDDELDHGLSARYHRCNHSFVIFRRSNNGFNDERDNWRYTRSWFELPDFPERLFQNFLVKYLDIKSVRQPNTLYVVDHDRLYPEVVEKYHSMISETETVQLN